MVTLAVLAVCAAQCNAKLRAEALLACAGPKCARLKQLCEDVLTPYFRLAGFMFLNIGYAYITMSALESIDCVPMQQQEKGASRALWLERRPETLCWTETMHDAGLGATHWPLGVLAIFVLIFYSVGYPLVSLAFIYWQFFHRRDGASASEKHAVLVEQAADQPNATEATVGDTIEMSVLPRDATAGTALCSQAFAGESTTIAIAQRSSGTALTLLRAHSSPGFATTASSVNPLAAPRVPSFRLPAGWVGQTDPASGAPYYEHVESGATQWARPAMSRSGEDDDGATRAQQWVANFDALTNASYFVNVGSGESVWELPVGGTLIVAIVDEADELSAEETAAERADEAQWPLPAGWKLRRVETGEHLGEAYFEHVESGETTWTRPRRVGVAADVAVERGAAVDDDGVHGGIRAGNEASRDRGGVTPRSDVSQSVRIARVVVQGTSEGTSEATRPRAVRAKSARMISSAAVPKAKSGREVRSSFLLFAHSSFICLLTYSFVHGPCHTLKRSAHR